MSITLFPCGTIPCPCPVCPSFLDYIRTEAPEARVVIYKETDPDRDLTGGAVTYEPAGGGTPVVVGMSVVGPASKLCLGRSQSETGPLVYASGIPVDATITEIYVEWVDGSFTRTVAASCENPLEHILREERSLDCYATPTVVAASASCDPCTEATGSSSSTIAQALGASFYWYNGTTWWRGVACSDNLLYGLTCAGEWWGQSFPHPDDNTVSSGAPPSWTPSAGSRPCNWSSVEFVKTLSLSAVFSGVTCAGTISLELTATFTKNLGDDQIYVSAPSRRIVVDARTDGHCDTAEWGRTVTDGTYDIPCTGYRLRLTTNLHLFNASAGGGPYVSSTGNQLIATLEPR